MWIQDFQAKYFYKEKPCSRTEFNKVLGYCAAVTSGPANYFSPELVEAYPDAKVIIVKWDFDSRFESFTGS